MIDLHALDGYFPAVYADFVKELGDRLHGEDMDARVERLRKSVLGDEYAPRTGILGLSAQLSIPIVVRAS